TFTARSSPERIQPRTVCSPTPYRSHTSRTESVLLIASALLGGQGGGNANDQRFNLGPVEPDRSVREQHIGQTPLTSEPFGPARLPPQPPVKIFSKKKHAAFLLRKFMGSNAARTAFRRFREVS